MEYYEYLLFTCKEDFVIMNKMCKKKKSNNNVTTLSIYFFGR